MEMEYPHSHDRITRIPAVLSAAARAAVTHLAGNTSVRMGDPADHRPRECCSWMQVMVTEEHSLCQARA